MEILAGSESIQTDSFLHAGYLSAYPRTYERTARYRLELVAENGQAKLIEVKDALALKQEGDATEATPIHPAMIGETAEPAPDSVPPGSLLASGFVALIAVCFFAFVASAYYRRLKGIRRPGWRPWAIGGVAGLLILCTGYFAGGYSVENGRLVRYTWKGTSPATPPPWEDVEVREYRDPRAATEVILSGLIVNALAGCSNEVLVLSQIRNEVSFPVPFEQYTPGMAYAQQTYGLDGWGRAFTFEPLPKGKYRIASAGPDGLRGNDDDIVLTTRSKDYDWERLIGGIYVREVDNRYAFFVHRVRHSLFRFANRSGAIAVTKTDRFDMVSLEPALRDSWREDGSEKILPRLERERETAGTSDPLYLLPLATNKDV